MSHLVPLVSFCAGLGTGAVALTASIRSEHTRQWAGLALMYSGIALTVVLIFLP